MRRASDVTPRPAPRVEEGLGAWSAWEAVEAEARASARAMREAAQAPAAAAMAELEGMEALGRSARARRRAPIDGALEQLWLAVEALRVERWLDGLEPAPREGTELRGNGGASRATVVAALDALDSALGGGGAVEARHRQGRGLEVRWRRGGCVVGWCHEVWKDRVDEWMWAGWGAGAERRPAERRWRVRRKAVATGARAGRLRAAQPHGAGCTSLGRAWDARLVTSAWRIGDGRVLVRYRRNAWDAEGERGGPEGLWVSLDGSSGAILGIGSRSDALEGRCAAETVAQCWPGAGPCTAEPAGERGGRHTERWRNRLKELYAARQGKGPLAYWDEHGVETEGGPVSVDLVRRERRIERRVAQAVERSEAGIWLAAHTDALDGVPRAGERCAAGMQARYAVLAEISAGPGTGRWRRTRLQHLGAVARVIYGRPAGGALVPAAAARRRALAAMDSNADAHVIAEIVLPGEAARIAACAVPLRQGRAIGTVLRHCTERPARAEEGGIDRILDLLHLSWECAADAIGAAGEMVRDVAGEGGSSGAAPGRLAALAHAMAWGWERRVPVEGGRRELPRGTMRGAHDALAGVAEDRVLPWLAEGTPEAEGRTRVLEALCRDGVERGRSRLQAMTRRWHTRAFQRLRREARRRWWGDWTFDPPPVLARGLVPATALEGVEVLDGSRALEAEGEAMGSCVGGYTGSVLAQGWVIVHVEGAQGGATCTLARQGSGSGPLWRIVDGEGAYGTRIPEDAMARAGALAEAMTRAEAAHAEPLVDAYRAWTAARRAASAAYQAMGRGGREADEGARERAQGYALDVAEAAYGGWERWLGPAL